MDHIKLRRISNSTIALLLGTIILFIGAASLLLYQLYLEDLALFYMFTCIYTALFFIPLTVITVIALYRYCTKVYISEAGISITYPAGKQINIERNRISAMGRMSLGRGKLYFCTAPKCEVLQFLREHQKQCSRMFGQQRMETLAASEDGCWKMAVTIYAYHSKKQGIFYLYHYSETLLTKISSLLKLTIINIGPVKEN